MTLLTVIPKYKFPKNRDIITTIFQITVPPPSRMTENNSQQLLKMSPIFPLNTGMGYNIFCFIPFFKVKGLFF